MFRKKEKYVPRRRLPEERIETERQVFQRNRTITGSVSDRLSTPGRLADLESPRTKAHHLAITRRKVGTVFLIVLASTLLISWLLGQFTARVAVSVADATVASKIEVTTYQQAIQDYFGTNPFERFRFALDKTRLLNHLNVEHPEVGSIDKVDAGGAIGEASFQLTMRQPVAGWMVAGTQYYVDSSGMAFEKNYYTAPVLAISDESGIGVEQGVPIASNRFLSFVGKVVAVAKTYKYTVTKATIPASTTRQLDIKLKGVRPTIRLSLDRGVGEQVEDMARSIDYLRQKGRTASYIDVRVAGKAFYR